MLTRSTILVLRRFSSCAAYYGKNKGKLFEILNTMPKNQSKRIIETQRQRLNTKDAAEKGSPGTVYLQVIGSGAEGAPKTLYVFTDQKRYLFNCGEGTQRLAHEHKVKLSRLEHIFITTKTWMNVGGLPGVSLTLQDVGVPEITLHGPPGLDELYHATRRFIVMKDMKVSMAQCDTGHDFQDNCMNVKYVLLGPDEDYFNKSQPSKKSKMSKDLERRPGTEIAEEFVHDDTDYYMHEKQEKPQLTQESNKIKAIKNPDTYIRKAENVITNLKKMTECSVAYICTLKKRLGTLDLEKCVELGVKPGPLLGLLKKGQDVMLENGKVVRSKDVKTPDDPGPVFIVIDVPDITYLKEDQFKVHFDNGTNPSENIPTVIVHFSPKNVIFSERYQQFMRLFGETTEHLVINEQNTCQGLVAAHRVQQKINILDNEIYPLLRDNSIPQKWHNAAPPTGEVNNLKEQVALAHFKSILKNAPMSAENEPKLVDDIQLLHARTLTTYHLRPKKGLDRSSELSLQVDEYIAEAMQVEGFAQALKQFKEEAWMCGRSDRYPKVVFLGTGSCIPNKTRNTSAIVLHLDESHSILLDCGEGTFGQMVRFYGKRNIGKFLETLKAIYVSHLHADHHIGLIGVLQGRQRILSSMSAFERQTDPSADTIYLMAPGQIMTWLSVYDQQFENIKDQFHLIPNSTLLSNEEVPSTKAEGISPLILSAMGLASAVTCLVSHCPNAFGVAFTTENYEKITYSGDTIPCDNLIHIGRNSDLLIHEATMEDDLADEARVKMHSTSSQAVNAGMEMHANFVILTHFSQRYARLPRLSENVTQAGNVGVAFDNMQVSLGNVQLLTKMYKALHLMFADHVNELEAKAAKRARTKERKRSLSPPKVPTAHQTINDDVSVLSQSSSLEEEIIESKQPIKHEPVPHQSPSLKLKNGTIPKKQPVQIFRAGLPAMVAINTCIRKQHPAHKITFSVKPSEDNNNSLLKSSAQKRVRFQNRPLVRESRASLLRINAGRKPK